MACEVHDDHSTTGTGGHLRHNGEPTYLEEPALDLVGGPFAVIESDPGVFTSLIRNLGIRGIEVEEVYDVQPWALDRLKPKGLILCFVWSKDQHHPDDFLDPAAKNVWFANQLVDDGCASLAILNVLFNCPDIELGEELSHFKSETDDMNSVMKGLAISNSSLLRDTQNRLARPSDLWGARSALAEATRDATKAAAKPLPKKKKRTDLSETTKARAKKKPVSDAKDEAETFHFIGYVPAYGKVWELDGLKTGPLEVGELPSADSTEGWEDVVRPALRLKMNKYGGGAGVGESGCIQFNLLALVEDRYQVKSDELEILKREKVTIERRLLDLHGADWRQMVNADLALNAADVFTTSAHSSEHGPTFAKNFGSRSMEKSTSILNTPESELLCKWEACVTSAMKAKVAVEDEVQKAFRARRDMVKRTHDYEPFIREYITALKNEGSLDDVLPTKPNESKRRTKGLKA